MGKVDEFNSSREKEKLLMKKYSGKIRVVNYCLVGILFFTTSVLLGSDSTQSKSIPEHLVVKIEPFRPVANSLGLPQVYGELDSLLEYFFRNVAQYPLKNSSSQRMEEVTWDENSISNEYLQDIARTVFRTHFYPDSLYHMYCRQANQPVANYMQQLNSDRRNGITRTDVNYPAPGWILNKYFCRTLIPKRLSGEYNILLQYRYILEIEPISKENKFINPALKYTPAIYYNAKVIKDFKGNFIGSDIITVSTVKAYLKGALKEMEIGKKYIVFIWLDGPGAYGHEYILRGFATQGRGIFSIENGDVNDKDRILYPGKSKYGVTDFENHMKSFIDTNLWR